MTNSVDLDIPFLSAKEAEIACNTLSVDKEPKRGHAQKIITVKDKCLNLHLEAKDVRTLRVSLNSFFDHLRLVVQTIHMFRGCG